MARRRHLKGVAAGLIGSFLSRNNDVDGWWALGLLRLGHLELDGPPLVIDLFVDDEGDDVVVVAIRARYRDLLARLLERHGVDAALVCAARISVRVVPYDESVDGLRPLRGDLIRGIAEIIDDRGVIFRATGMTRCDPHDPHREQRAHRP